MKTQLLSFSFFLFLSVLLVSSCGDKEESCDGLSANYDNNVEAIINNSCATSGCHDGTGANAAIPASANDLTSYTAIESSILNNGKFANRVFEVGDMPPPGISQVALSEEAKDILQCWMDDNFPEN